MPKSLRLAALLALLPFLVPAACHSEEGPKLPDGVDALPSELNLRMKELLKNAEQYRGLKCLHGVPSGSLKEDALRIKMKLAFEEELPPAKMRPLDAALKSFGFIPEKLDLAKYYPELLTSQVGGYYDPRRQYLVIVQRDGGLLGKDAEKTLGKDMAKRMEETVMVHELTHAIQDQHFNLQKFCIEDPLSDASAARIALVEGDATLTMYNYFAGMNLDEMPMIDEVISMVTKDPKELMAMSPDMPGAKEMESAPAWFRDGMLFSYMQGYVFCIKVKKAGGQPLLDLAFTKDPPRSTEQILHPDKWFGAKRDDPVEIKLPDLAADLPGWTKASEGTLGELGIRIWLNETLKDVDASNKAAEGWGGDRFAVYEKDGARMLCWVTDWDTVKDATKFRAACEKLGADWTVTSDMEKRVMATRSELKADAVRGPEFKTTVAVHKTLKLAEASTPENKPIDIPTLRNKRAKNEAPMLAEETKKKANDPKDLLGKDGEVDVDKVLENPNIKDALKGLGADTGIDMGEMMKNPAMKEMLKSMLAQKAPGGKLTPDGRGYTNAAMGVEMKMPESAAKWTLSDKGPMPMILVLAENAETGAQVQIAAQPLPIEMPIESLAPMLEMGFKMALKEFKKFKEGPIGEGASKGYEVQYSGEQQGVRARVTSRFYMRNGKLLVINATTEESRWETNEKMLNQILDGIKVGKPVAVEEKTLKE